MSKLPSIIRISYLEAYTIKVTFDNNLEKLIDYAPFIKNGVSGALRDSSYFRQGKIEDGYLVWPNGYDCCPQLLFEL